MRHVLLIDYRDRKFSRWKAHQPTHALYGKHTAGDYRKSGLGFKHLIDSNAELRVDGALVL